MDTSSVACAPRTEKLDGLLIDVVVHVVAIVVGVEDDDPHSVAVVVVGLNREVKGANHDFLFLGLPEIGVLGPTHSSTVTATHHAATHHAALTAHHGLHHGALAAGSAHHGTIAASGTAHHASLATAAAHHGLHHGSLAAAGHRAIPTAHHAAHVWRWCDFFFLLGNEAGDVHFLPEPGLEEGQRIDQVVGANILRSEFVIFLGKVFDDVVVVAWRPRPPSPSTSRPSDGSGARDRAAHSADGRRPGS